MQECIWNRSQCQRGVLPLAPALALPCLGTAALLPGEGRATRMKFIFHFKHCSAQRMARQKCKTPIAFQVGPSAEDFRVCFSCVLREASVCCKGQLLWLRWFSMLKTMLNKCTTARHGVFRNRSAATEGRNKQKQSRLCFLPDLRSMTVIT